MRNRISFLIAAAIIILSMFFSSCTGKESAAGKGKDDSVSVLKVIDDGIADNINSNREVSIMAVGDNLLHINVVNDSKKSDGKYDFKPIYENIKDEIANADIAMINQETILGGSKLGYSGYPCFNSPQEAGRDLVQLGFDVINHANNHVLDKGIRGINNTLDFWNKYPGVMVTGLFKNYEDRQKIRIIDKNGIKIAFLSYTYGTNGIPIPKDNPNCVSLIDKTRIANDVERAKESADAVVVSMHWGNEYAPNPSKAQMELAAFLADAGVTLVIGHHPHVLQPIKMLKGKSGNDTLVVYSLGNLISGQDEIPRLLGGLLKVTIVKKADGSIGIKNPAITPLVTHYETGGKGFKIYPLNKYTDTLAKRHGIIKYGETLSIDKLNKIALPVIKSIDDIEKAHMVVDSTNHQTILLSYSSKKFDTEKLSRTLDSIAKKYRAIGMSVVVVRNGKIEMIKNYGIADKEKKIPVNDDTVYRIASISKTITNMVAMTLYDKGKLNINEDISKYLGYRVKNPNYPNTSITLKSIMVHTSSINDNGTYSSIVCSGKGTPALKDMVTPGSKAYSKNNFYRCIPDGKTFFYSNFGAGIMGTIIESISGSKLNEYAKDSLFKPMNLDAGFLIDDITNINKVANLYIGGRLNYSKTDALKDRDLFAGLPAGQNYRIANGNVYISARDLAKLMILLMNDGEYDGKSILSKDAVDLMEMIHWSGSSGFHKLQGLNLHITDDLVMGRRLYGHQGRAYGVLAEMYYDPKDKTGVVFISNGASDITASNGFTSIGSDVINAVYKELSK